MQIKISKPALIIAAVSLALMVAGTICWAQNLMYTTNTVLTDYDTWGLSIIAFLFLEALAAGALLFAGICKDTDTRIKLALISVAGGIGAGIAITTDIGNPLNAWRLFFSPNINAPMTLDVWFLTLTIVAGIALYVCARVGKETVTNLVGKAAVVVAIALPIGTALMFVSLTGRAGWHSSLEVVAFLASAVLAGALCMMLIGKAEKPIILTALAALLVNVVIVIADLAQAFYSNMSAEAASLIELLNGPHAVLFGAWIALFLLVPAILLALKKQGILASVLGIIGIFVGKYLFVIEGNQLAYQNLAENLQIPFLATGVTGFIKAPIYVPTIQEWLVALGSIAVTVFVIALAWSLLLKKAKEA